MFDYGTVFSSRSYAWTQAATASGIHGETSVRQKAGRNSKFANEIPQPLERRHQEATLIAEVVSQDTTSRLIRLMIHARPFGTEFRTRANRLERGDFGVLSSSPHS